MRDRGAPASDTPWEEIPTGSDAIAYTQCGPYADAFARGQVATAGTLCAPHQPLEPADLIRVVGPTEQQPFGGRHFAASGHHSYVGA